MTNTIALSIYLLCVALILGVNGIDYASMKTIQNNYFKKYFNLSPYSAYLTSNILRYLIQFLKICFLQYFFQ